MMGSCIRKVMTGVTLMTLAFAITPAVRASDQPEFQVDSAAVVAIRQSLAVRYLQLKTHFQQGVIGYTQDGLIALRESASLAKEQRAELERLISEENKDRGTMYREIARANNRPDWEGRFRSVFAERWISRAPVGWYYRNSSGTWIKKVPPVS